MKKLVLVLVTVLTMVLLSAPAVVSAAKVPVLPVLGQIKAIITDQNHLPIEGAWFGVSGPGYSYQTTLEKKSVEIDLNGLSMGWYCVSGWPKPDSGFGFSACFELTASKPTKDLGNVILALPNYEIIGTPGMILTQMKNGDLLATVAGIFRNNDVSYQNLEVEFSPIFFEINAIHNPWGIYFPQKQVTGSPGGAIVTRGGGNYFSFQVNYLIKRGKDPAKICLQVQALEKSSGKPLTSPQQTVTLLNPNPPPYAGQ